MQIRILVFKFLNSCADLLYLQKSQDRECESEKGKTNQCVKSHCKLLRKTHKPRHVKSIDKHRGDEDAVLFEPFVAAAVNELKAVKIAQEPMTDLTAAPRYPKCKQGQHSQCHQNRNKKRDKLRYFPLQGTLERPDNCDRENRKCDRHENRASERERGGHENPR